MNKSRYVIFAFVLYTILCCITACKAKEKDVKQEPYIVETYEATLNKQDSSEEIVLKTYYKMSDGTWKTDEYTYQYRLVISGTLNNAVKDSTYIILSNRNDITFEQAWKASGLSSSMSDYFDPKESKIVEIR